MAGEHLESVNFVPHGEGWQGTLSVQGPNGCRGVTLAVTLPASFPDAPPIVTVADDSLPQPLAHLNSDKLCLYQDHSVVIDTSRPAEVIRDTLARAEKILTEGLSGQSNAARWPRSSWPTGALRQPGRCGLSSQQAGWRRPGMTFPYSVFA